MPIPVMHCQNNTCFRHAADNNYYCCMACAFDHYTMYKEEGVLIHSKKCSPNTWQNIERNTNASS